MSHGPALPYVVILKNCVNNVFLQYTATRGGTRLYDKRNPLAVLFYNLCFLFMQCIRVPYLRRQYYLTLNQSVVSINYTLNTFIAWCRYLIWSTFLYFFHLNNAISRPFTKFLYYNNVIHWGGSFCSFIAGYICECSFVKYTVIYSMVYFMTSYLYHPK